MQTSSINNLLELEASFLKRLQNEGKSFNTVKNYRTDLNIFNNFLDEKQNHLNLVNLSTEFIMEYSHYIDKKYDSDNSRRRRIQALRLFFDYLLEFGKVNENPVKKIPVSPKTLDAPNPTLQIEIIKLVHALSEKIDKSNDLEKLICKRNLFLVHLIYGCGLKVSDISSLTIKSIITSNDGYRLMVIPPKRDPYSIPVPPETTSFISSYINELQKFKDSNKLDEQGLLFNANSYSIISPKISPRGIEIIFKKFKEELSINLSAKNLRQACIIKWISYGHNDSLVKEWLGVAPSYSLKTYREFYKKEPNIYNYSELN